MQRLIVATSTLQSVESLINAYQSQRDLEEQNNQRSNDLQELSCQLALREQEVGRREAKLKRDEIQFARCQENHMSQIRLAKQQRKCTSKNTQSSTDTHIDSYQNNGQKIVIIMCITIISAVICCYFFL